MVAYFKLFPYRYDDIQKNIYVAKLLTQIDTKGPCYRGKYYYCLFYSSLLYQQVMIMFACFFFL